MITYRLAWLNLIAQRDTLYLQLAAAVISGGGLFFMYHGLWPSLAVKLAFVGGFLSMAAAIAIGFILWE
jgi:hypothetical protein